MNTEQRKILRNALYVLAAVLSLGGCIAIEEEPGISILAVIGAVACAGAGAFIWAGRPAQQISSLAGDISELSGKDRKD